MVVGDVLDVGVPVAVPLPVDVPLVLIVEDIEIESVPLCVFEKLTPSVCDDKGVFAMLVEILMVLDNVAIAVGEGEPVPTLDGDIDDEVVTVPEGEIVNGGVDEPLSVIEGLSLPEGVTVGAALGVSLALSPKEIVDEGVSELEVDIVDESLMVGGKVMLCVAEGEGLKEIVIDGVVVPEFVTVGVIELLAPRVTVVVGVVVDEEVTEALAEAVALIKALELTISVCRLLIETLAEGQFVTAITLGDISAVTVSTATPLLDISAVIDMLALTLAQPLRLPLPLTLNC